MMNGMSNLVFSLCFQQKLKFLYNYVFKMCHLNEILIECWICIQAHIIFFAFLFFPFNNNKKPQHIFPTLQCLRYMTSDVMQK